MAAIRAVVMVAQRSRSVGSGVRGRPRARPWGVTGRGGTCQDESLALRGIGIYIGDCSHPKVRRNVWNSFVMPRVRPVDRAGQCVWRVLPVPSRRGCLARVHCARTRAVARATGGASRLAELVQSPARDGRRLAPRRGRAIAGGASGLARHAPGPALL